MNRLSDSTLEYLKKARTSITGQKELRNDTSLITIEVVVPTKHVDLIYTEEDKYLELYYRVQQAVNNGDIDKRDLARMVDEIYEI